MFSEALKLLKTPIWHFAPVRWMGSSITFFGGLTAMFYSAQLIGDASLEHKHIRVLGIGVAGALAAFLVGLPFAATPLGAATYGCALIFFGILNLERYLTPHAKEITAFQHRIKQIDKHTKLLNLDASAHTVMRSSARYELNRELFYTVLSQENAVFRLVLDEDTRDFDNLSLSLGKNSEALELAKSIDIRSKTFPHVFHIDGNYVIVSERPKKLPEKLPTTVTLQEKDFSNTWKNFEINSGIPLKLYDRDLSSLSGEKVTTLEELEKLIPEANGDAVARALLATHVWRYLCEKAGYLFPDQVSHPKISQITIKTRSA